MKPYYDDGQCVIYHGDCREVLETLPASSVDLVLTDPPYGVRWQSGSRNQQFSTLVGDTSTDAALHGLKLSLRCLRNARHVYVFGRYDFTGLPLSTPAELIWDKGQLNGGDLSSPWGPQHEYIQFTTNVKSRGNLADGYGKSAARLRRGSILSHPRLNATAVQLHPTEKPVQLLRELIEMSSRFNEIVLDPFVGSGTTLLASKLEGRRAIGIEIEERYCEIAANRLRQEVLPLEAV